LRIPRDLSGDDLDRVVAVLGYAVTRQTGSHIRLTTQESGEHHITIPRHEALRVGTLAAITILEDSVTPSGQTLPPPVKGAFPVTQDWLDAARRTGRE
jgi:predicted RNA binding protein YcfA (HicA-like mRNA interferase family)